MKYKSIFEIIDIIGEDRRDQGYIITTNMYLQFQNYKFLGVNVPNV